jgi:ATP-GRASP peptide maturase of grasp-with-spasm system
MKRPVIVLEDDDFMAYNVIDWLLSFGRKPIVINDSLVYSPVRLTISNFGYSMDFNNEKERISLENISSYWFRRGILHINTTFIEGVSNAQVSDKINSFIAEETKALKEGLFKALESSSTSLGTFRGSFQSKLGNLLLASKCGLDIPDTVILTSKEDLIDFFSKHSGKIITKSMSEAFGFSTHDKLFFALTEAVTQRQIENAAPVFYPTLFQEFLDKYVELRIFYLKGRCHSMAIFSQNDEQTKVDFRNYNLTNPNRVVPYLLPDQIATQIQAFMNKVNLDTGSLDLIRTNDDRYVFLEVNPVGQFGMIDYPCNYYLGKEIASILSSD